MKETKTVSRQVGLCRRSVGFTLIELLVVVSIIALLIAILLPSLRNAREQAKKAVCIAHLKGIATASAVYATDDPTEAAIPAGYRLDPANGIADARIAAYAYGGKAGKGEQSTADPAFMDDPDSAYWGTNRHMGPAHRPLNGILYKSGFKDWCNVMTNPGTKNRVRDSELDLGIYRCPSDNGYRGVHYKLWRDSGISSYDFFGTSYSANVFWIGVTDSSCTMDSNSPFLRPYSRVPNPANTIYYMENVGRFAWQAYPDPCTLGSVPGIGGVCHGWHRKDWNFSTAFVDGHAGTILMRSYKSVRVSFYPPDPRYPRSNDYNFWRCVIIRGSGWQVDTLPSPPVTTVFRCPQGDGRPSLDGKDLL